MTAPEERFLQLYDMVERGRFDTYYPGDLSVCRGAIDPHVHANWNRVDPVAQVQHATRAGMRAVVFKIMQFPSVEVARLTNEAVATWAEPQQLEPCEAIGGVVLGSFVGGLNLETLRYAIAAGARCLWFPTISSAQHHARTRQKPIEDMVRDGRDYLLDGGQLVPAAREALRMAADASIATSFGHASWPEIQALAEECQRIGYRSAMVDHPLNPVIGLSVDQVAELADSGVLINLTAVELQAYIGIAPAEFREVLARVGPEAVILSSDAGLRMMPESVECMRQLVEMLRLFGYDDGQIHQMVAGSAARALGIAV